MKNEKKGATLQSLNPMCACYDTSGLLLVFVCLKASGRVQGTVESGEVGGGPPDGRVGKRTQSF